jgi:CDP-glycerol glycerophosphotransferase (TagB/SpsB family)
MNTISSNKSEDVVFISQGADTTFLKNIALNLRSKIPNRIIYRLHPNELVDSYVDLKENNIEVSTYGDVYELLNSVKYVIGSYSTVLIEAIMFGKKVLVHNNFYSDEFIPKQFGIRFLTVDDILDIMKIEDSYEDFDNQLWAFKSIDNLHKINEIENLW